jgi:hypothetical protein
MATPVGTNILNSISRRYLLPEVTDNVYRSNPLLFRLIAAKKKLVQGGLQIELPLMYGRFAAGGPYQGFDQLTIAPSDTVKNAALDWKQHYVPLAIDGLSLIKANSPDAIANLIRLLSDQSQMEMAENLAVGMWSDGSNVKDLDGLKVAIDDGTVNTTYAGLSRTTNTWWKSKIDSTTATLTLAAVQALFGNCTEGGRAPTIIISRQEQYNRFWALNAASQQFPVQPGGSDEVLASAGFTNLLFNNTPWAVDSHVFDGPNASNSAIVMLNEDFIYWFTTPRGDFAMEDWQKPPDQDAYVSMLLFAGNIGITNDARQGKLSNVAA